MCVVSWPHVPSLRSSTWVLRSSWLAWFVVAALAACLRPAPFAARSPDLVPAEHRATPGVLVVLHRRSAPDEAWTRVLDTLGPQLPGHLPPAPPPAEARLWRDAHLLWWVADGPALAARFEPAALRAAVSGVRARLTSPLFDVGGEDVRRDPLGLADLGGMHTPPWLAITASGDRMSADGNTLLIHLQTAMPPEAAAASVSAQLSAQFSSDSPEVADIEVRAFVLGSESPELSQPVRGLSTNLALLAFVLALGLRRLRTSLAALAVLTTGAVLVPFLDGSLILALLGAAAALAVGSQPRTPPASPPPEPPIRRTLPWLLLASALVPLVLLPYPAWRETALTWPLAVLVLALGVSLVLPALTRVLRAPPADLPARDSPRPLPSTVALAACAVLLAAGTWSIGHVPTDSVVAPTPPALLGLLDTARLAELHSRGDSPSSALAAAARDARDVAAAVPGAWPQGPAAFVLDDDTLATRSATLATLDLPGRIDLLRANLAEQGLRPDAFAEFFRAVDLGHQPSPTAALAGPLGPWLTAHLHNEGAFNVVVTRVHLPDTLPDTLPSQLRGPVVFAHEVQREFLGHLGLALVASAWLSAFLTWLSTRRLGSALTAAVVGASAQVGALAIAAAIHGEISPAVLPAALLVGATTASACNFNSPLGRPRSSLASACAAIPGIVLLLDPAWHATGLVLALGAALGGLLASHAAPALSALLTRREARP